MCLYLCAWGIDKVGSCHNPLLHFEQGIYVSASNCLQLVETAQQYGRLRTPYSCGTHRLAGEHARDNLRKASDSLKDTWRQIKDKEAIAKPLREERDKTKNSKSQFKQRFEGLQVRTGG